MANNADDRPKGALAVFFFVINPLVLIWITYSALTDPRPRAFAILAACLVGNAWVAYKLSTSWRKSRR